MTSPRRTGLVWHERLMWHEQGIYSGLMQADYPVQPGIHHEHPNTKRRLKNLLDASDFSRHLVPIALRRAARDELARVHTPAYLDRLEALDAVGGQAGLDAPVRPGSVELAYLAAGGVLAATDAVLNGHVQNAYCLIRPVGHHAEPDGGMGFCLLANGSIAAAHALARGLKRVAIVDFDVHHGNGAETVFWRNPQVLTISVHQDNWFPPGRGGTDARGEGPGLGFNINVPLPAGSGFGAYQAAFKRVIIPALDEFRPELIVVAAGYDASAQDQLGRMILGSSHFRFMAQELLAAAERHSAGRLLATHEGGYNESTVPFHGIAVIEEMASRSSGVTDPYGVIFDEMPGHDLMPHQDAAVARAAEALPLLKGAGQRAT